MKRLIASLVLTTLLSALAAGCTRSAAPGPGQNGAPAGQPGPDGATGGQPVSDAAACPSGNTAVYVPPAGQEAGPANPPTASATGTADRPAIQLAELGMTESFGERGGTYLGSRYIVRSGTAIAGTHPFVFTARLQPAPDQAWHRQNVQVAGVERPPLRTELVEQGIVELPIPAGRAGERIEIALTSVTLPDGSQGDLKLSLCRQEEPRVSLAYQAPGGAWEPVTPQTFVPASRPLTLRATFTNPMDRASAEQALTRQPVRAPEGTPAPTVTWESDQVALVTYPDPPPVIQMAMHGVRDVNGLYVVGGLPVVHTGDPAHAVAVDLASGAEHRLADLMPEITDGTVSPDGRYLLVQAVNWQTSGYVDELQHAWRVDLTSGERVQLPYGTYAWLPGGELLLDRWRGEPALVRYGADAALASEHPVPQHFRSSVSPDGSKVALLVMPDAGQAEPGDYLQPLDLVIADTTGKVLQTLPRVVRMYRPPTEWQSMMAPAWSPDGRQIALMSDNKENRADLVLVDLAAGTARSQRLGLEGGQPISWSPDGKWLLSGRTLLDAATGAPVRRLDQIARVTRWSPDGKQVLVQAQDWDEVTAVTVATGEARSLGQGLPLGWDANGRALVVRWAGAPYRWVPDM